jgi:hypothetical protein
MQMSKNFELLRRARKEQSLFAQPIGDSAVNQEARACLDDKTVGNEVVKAEKREAVWPGPKLSEIAQGELVKLVQRVFVFPNSHAPRTVCFSSLEGSGSSEACFHSGEILAAQESASVCLVDANLYTPSLHRLLGVDKSPGLVDATIRPGPMEDYAVPIGRGNLWLVPPGSPRPEIQGFSWDRLRSRVIELKERFDFVFIDAPPLSSHSDAVLFGQMTDGLILVLEANSTRREMARMAKENLESAKVKILGAILNNRTFPIPETLYRIL